MNEQQERERFEKIFSKSELQNYGDEASIEDALSILWSAWIVRASQDHAEVKLDMVSTVSSDEAFFHAVHESPDMVLEDGDNIEPVLKGIWNAALQYAAEQKSERDRKIEEVFASYEQLAKNDYSAIEHIRIAVNYAWWEFDRIHAIWRGGK